MMYRAKCTHCAPLLMNTDKFKDAPFCHDKYDTYIEVHSEELATMIEHLNGYQEGTYKTYKQILNYTEKEA